ncbi:beta-galactosidase [Geothrix limicola]|uniref:Beta-galactosidase n=1 Tax=Geothrix limicola TaxID=2927978 RepID=A0ABQ5QBS3_9BACT|nr:beta-galactosidase family protein [Geothrix limicola]GLH71504.1 beta-galactosidase [Geothrix limicola]
MLRPFLFLGALAWAALPVFAGPTKSAPKPVSFTVQGERFLLDGKPFVIRSGEMHYPRVPRADWRDRMKKMRAMGLNTLCTYVFWNLHEPEPGRFDFSGDLDLAAYLRTAQEEGLKVILRPGPYICTEWEFGGLPAWLLKAPDMKVRTADPRFLEAAARYLKRVGQEVDSLQADRGGPILMVQVENEYGSFGSDMAYKSAIRKAIVDAGFRVRLYTSDGPGQDTLAGGTFPDLVPTVNFGAGPECAEAFAELDKFRSGIPRMCGEYWAGWFDHYGKPHHTTDAKEGAAGVTWMLQRGISFNLYMFHGGTNFGFMNGANWTGRYAPDTTSYDYDVMLDEAGRPTPKFFAYREVIRPFLAKGETLPELPAPQPLIEIPTFRFTESAPLSQLLKTPVHAEAPLAMEALDQSYGYVLYRRATTHATKEVLEIGEVRDYALVLQGERRFGSLDRRLRQTCLDVDLAAGEPLDILVENTGRINFDKAMLAERKGILGKVSLGGQELKGWDCYSLPLSDLSGLSFRSGDLAAPAFHRASFDLKAPGATFLDLRGWGKGQVFVNGRNLGRHWNLGPMGTLYCPASFLKAGPNEVIVLELEPSTQRDMSGLVNPALSLRPALTAKVP